MKKYKEFAGRKLRFVSVKEDREQFYIHCETEDGQPIYLGISEGHDPMFMSEKDALEYWNQEDAYDYKGEPVWGMEG